MQLVNPPQQSPSTSLSTESFLVQQPPPTLPFPPKNHLSTCLLVSTTPVVLLIWRMPQ